MPKRTSIRRAVCHPERRHLARGLCKACYEVWYRINNPSRYNKGRRDWARRNPEKRLATRRKYLYGIDDATVKARLKAQDGLCKICNIDPAAHLDHDHTTNKSRSLLCGHCNRGLGLFRDDPARLRSAARYVELWRTVPK